EPGGFVVAANPAEVALDLFGENLWDADRLWTERNVRVYARHASGDEPWLRLFTGSGDVGSGSPEDPADALPHGHAVATAPRPSPASARRGPFQLPPVSGARRRAAVGRWHFQEPAASNILRLPVADAPHRAPEIREVSPTLLPARHDGGAAPRLWVRASDLTL